MSRKCKKKYTMPPFVLNEYRFEVTFRKTDELWRKQDLDGDDVVLGWIKIKGFPHCQAYRVPVIPDCKAEAVDLTSQHYPPHKIRLEYKDYIVEPIKLLMPVRECDYMETIQGQYELSYFSLIEQVDKVYDMPRSTFNLFKQVLYCLINSIDFKNSEWSNHNY